MKLVIGGYAQGKLEYVRGKYHLRESRIWDGVLPEDRELQEKPVVINHFQQWVKKRMEENGCPEEEIRSFLEVCGDCIIISDEIGNGIVPADPMERQYRECVGRILVRLAAQAEEVERILCGIGLKIK